MTDWTIIRDAREWMERVIRSGGPAVEQARALLEALDEHERNDSELADLLDKVDKDDCASIVAAMAEHEALEALIDDQESAGFTGTTLPERLTAGLADYEARLEEYWSIRSLLMDAGVLGPGDRNTEILPLLRLFVPEGE